MASGNLIVGQKFCKSCGKTVKAEKNGLAWGVGDTVLGLVTVGLSVVLKWIFFRSPWRCSQCGSKC